MNPARNEAARDDKVQFLVDDQADTGRLVGGMAHRSGTAQRVAQGVAVHVDTDHPPAQFRGLAGVTEFHRHVSDRRKEDFASSLQRGPTISRSVCG